jgi:hypothetical protein
MKTKMQKGGTARNKKMENPPKPPMKKGGSVRKMQAGGQSDKPYTRPKEFLPEKGPITDMKERKDLADLLLKYKADPRVTREIMRTGQLAPDITLKTKPSSEMRVGKTMKKGGAMKKMQKGGLQKAATKRRTIEKMMTGGMVNPNSSVSVLKAAGSKGVASGVNPKASSSKVAGSRGSGKVNTPPSKAVPTAKRGGMVKKKR